MKFAAFFKRLASFTDRKALPLSAFFLLGSLGSCYFVYELYANLKPDIEELLPTTSRSVMDLKEVTTRLRSIDNLAVLIFSQNSQAAGKFQQDLALELEKLPPTLSAAVEYKITEELRFFEKRKALFISKDDLQDIQKFIKKKIDYERFIYNPVNLVIENKPVEPKYSFIDLEGKYSSKTNAFAHFPGGVYSTEDGLNRLILVYAPDQSIGTAHALKDSVVGLVAKLDPKKYAPDLEVKYSGNVQDIIEEQAALLEDLILSTVLVMVLVLLVLWLYYRSFFATLALVGSLLVGTIFTFGISYFAVGYLNANSAFLGSIVMGNGINFGIMILARYLEERRSRGLEHLPALEISLRETVLPTFTAALAAAIAYGSLMLTSFRGFSQFGIIGFIGMAACWICAYTFFPAALSLLNRYVSVTGGERRAESRSLWSVGMKALLVKIPKPIVVVGTVISVASTITIFNLDKSIIESDLTKLRDKGSMEHGSGYLTRYIDLILKRYSSPIAVLAHNEEDAEKIAKALILKKETEGHASMIDSVMRVQDFVPPDQKEKITILRKIQEELPPKILWGLPDTEKARVKEFLSTETLTPFTTLDLPVKLLDRFREKNGNIGNLVLVEPPLTDEIRQGDSLLRFVKGIREVVDGVASNVPVAGRLPVSADMLAAVIKEGPIATAVSGLAVVVLTILLFRSVQLSALVLSSLFLGVMWLMAGMMWFHLKINFLNFIALPITFGIGVDYAVNVFHRYREELHRENEERQKNNNPIVPREQTAIVKAVYHTGGAVVLASMTTTIGWGSLLIAGNQAFVSFGKIAVIGEITCVTVAVLVIPAFLIWLQGRGKAE